MEWHQSGLIFRWNGFHLLEIMAKTTREELGSFAVGPKWRDPTITEVEEAIDLFCDELKTAGLKGKQAATLMTA